MFVQLLFPERVGDFSALQLDLLVFTALALFNYNSNHQDSVWDVSNRICDRYLPKLRHV